MKRTLPMLCAAALFASFALPASAQLMERPQRETVHYGDLDLYNGKDADVLLDRIDGAAYRVCGGDERSLSRHEEREFATCADRSADRAVDRVDHPMVTARANGLSPEVIIAEGDADYPAYSK